MFCAKCGKELSTDAAFCKNCGCKVNVEIVNSATDSNHLRKKYSRKKIVYLICVSVTLAFATIFIAVLSNDQNRLGNPQANFLNDYDYCCQASKGETYLCYPTSRTIWKYQNGELIEAYHSMYAIQSIFDTGSDIVIKSIDNGISIINKRTGEEKVIPDLWRSIVLNTYKNTLYYIVTPENATLSSTLCDYETYALNLKTGEKLKLENGGCYVSEEGVYFINPNNGMYEIKFLSHSKIRSSSAKVVDCVTVSSTDEIPLLINVFQGWYYYQLSNGDFCQTIIRKSGNTVEELFDARHFTFCDKSTICFQDNGSNFYQYKANGLEDLEKIVLKSSDRDFVIGADCISSFQDPLKKDAFLFCTIADMAGGYLCIWDEEGSMLTSVDINDAMFS